jgi:D-serine deaminase-like pyridoxal phosphate-dependent protein
MEANIDRLRRRMDALGVGLRPHVKTAKSLEIVRRLFDGGTGPITVSTLAEAEAFGGAGFTDVLYAVGISPAKLDRVLALHRQGIHVMVLLDSVEQAEAVARASRESGITLRALLEIDCDGHRGGVVRGDPAVMRIADVLGEGAELAGVLAHAGESYHARWPDELVAAAENERATAVGVAQDLRDAGHPAPVVSIGSTPTALSARDLTGVTEVRAGNYVFFDLVMAGIGVCDLDDLAISVVVTVIGHRPEKGWIVTDGGWMATSRDLGTSTQRVDQRYGIVTSLDGAPYPDLLMTDASQEHGILSLREGSGARLPHLPVGTRVRILPVHACATAAQHDAYHVLQPGSDGITAVWPRIRGW